VSDGFITCGFATRKGLRCGGTSCDASNQPGFCMFGLRSRRLTRVNVLAFELMVRSRINNLSYGSVGRLKEAVCVDYDCVVECYIIW